MHLLRLTFFFLPLFSEALAFKLSPDNCTHVSDGLALDGIPFNPQALLERSVRYDDHKVIELRPIPAAEVDVDGPMPKSGRTCALYSLLQKLTPEDGFSLFDYHEDHATALVNPSIYAILSASPSLSIKLLNDNFQDLIDQENRELIKTKQLKANFADLASWLSSFHDYNESKAFFKQLSTQYSNVIQWIPSIGKTHEGRDIFALKIGYDIASPAKKVVYLQSLQHAREWIAGSTVNYLAYNLVTDTSARVKALLQAITFVIVPIVNPDGYQYTWTTNRMWRKNRRPQMGKYFGVDLNRNWDSFFNTAGASSNPMSDVYQGPYAASEVEVSSCQSFYQSFIGQTIVALDIHTFGQLLLWPFSYTYNPYKFRPQYQELGSLLVAAIKNVSGKVYVANDSSSLYPSGGAAQDYFCDPKFNPRFSSTPYAFTWELRPSSSAQGFILPIDQIIPTGKEVWAALLVLVEYALLHPLALA